jgi:hypothetical protein
MEEFPIMPATNLEPSTSSSTKINVPAQAKAIKPKNIPASASHVIGGDKENEPHIPESPTAKTKAPVNSDLPNHQLTEADLQFEEVYGDHVHDNDGTHLDGGIADDALWQGYWWQLVEHLSHLFDIPNDTLGKRIIELTAEGMEGLQKRKWNSERLLVFNQVMLQRTQNVKRAKDVKRLLTHRMDLWDKGQYQLLFEITHKDRPPS